MFYSYRPSKCTLDYTLEENENSNTVSHRLEWRIPEFLSITNCKYVRQYETEYVDNITQETQFRLKIKFIGVHDNLMEIFYLHQKHVVDVKIYAELISALNFVNGFNTTVTANKWQYLLSIRKEKIKPLLNQSNILFKIWFVHNASSIVSNDITLEPEHKLSDNLEYWRSMSHDVIIKSAEGFEFKVHKQRLSSRSAVLKAHFSHDTLENKLNIMESPLDTEVLKEVLTYIYTDRAPRVQQMADKLLPAAEFYHLPGLKNISSDMLYLNLTKENVIDTLLLADLHSAQYLTKLTLIFIKNGHASFLTKTDSWKSLTSVNVIKAIYEAIDEPKK